MPVAGSVRIASTDPASHVHSGHSWIWWPREASSARVPESIRPSTARRPGKYSRQSRTTRKVSEGGARPLDRALRVHAEMHDIQQYLQHRLICTSPPGVPNGHDPAGFGHQQRRVRRQPRSLAGCRTQPQMVQMGPALRASAGWRDAQLARPAQRMGGAGPAAGPVPVLLCRSCQAWASRHPAEARRAGPMPNHPARVRTQATAADAEPGAAGDRSRRGHPVRHAAGGDVQIRRCCRYC